MDSACPILDPNMVAPLLAIANGPKPVASRVAKKPAAVMKRPAARTPIQESDEGGEDDDDDNDDQRAKAIDGEDNEDTAEAGDGGVWHGGAAQEDLFGGGEDEEAEEDECDCDEDEEMGSVNKKPSGVGKKRKRRRKKQRVEEEDEEEAEIRDRGKSRKFHELFSSLPGEVQNFVNQLKTRAEETAFINEVVVRKGRKLSIDHKVLVKTMMRRQEEQGASQKMRGYMLEEAVARVGSRKALDEALAGQRAVRRMKGGMEVFFFPLLEFTKASVMQHDVSSEMHKHGKEKVFNDMLKDQMGFKWDPLADGDGCSAGSGAIPLMLPGLDGGGGGGEGGCSNLLQDGLQTLGGGAPSDDDVKELSQLLGDLGRQQSAA